MALQSCTITGLTPCKVTTVFQQIGYIPSVEILVQFARDFTKVRISLQSEDKVRLARAWSTKLQS